VAPGGVALGGEISPLLAPRLGPRNNHPAGLFSILHDKMLVGENYLVLSVAPQMVVQLSRVSELVPLAVGQELALEPEGAVPKSLPLEFYQIPWL
jgi:hypothetical protein